MRGIKRMVEDDAYCTDILIQVSAVNSALNSFNKVLLANHIRTCVADDIRAGHEETIDELVGYIAEADEIRRWPKGKDNEYNIKMQAGRSGYMDNIP